MNLTKYEQETVVNYNAGEQTATVYTADKAAMRRFDSLVATYSQSSILYISILRPKYNMFQWYQELYH